MPAHRKNNIHKHHRINRDPTLSEDWLTWAWTSSYGVLCLLKPPSLTVWCVSPSAKILELETPFRPSLFCLHHRLSLTSSYGREISSLLCSETEGVTRVRASFRQLCPLLTGETVRERSPCALQSSGLAAVVPSRDFSGFLFIFFFSSFSFENMRAGPAWEAKPSLVL